MISEIDELKVKLLQLRKIITKLQRKENKPQIYSPLYRKDLKTRITEKIWSDKNFNTFLSQLNPDEDLKGRIRFNIIYQKPPLQGELYKDFIGLTREIIPNNERQIRKPKPKPKRDYTKGKDKKINIKDGSYTYER